MAPGHVLRLIAALAIGKVFLEKGNVPLLPAEAKIVHIYTQIKYFTS
jgi:hypothetical protein